MKSDSELLPAAKKIIEERDNIKSFINQVCKVNYRCGGKGRWITGLIERLILIDPDNYSIPGLLVIKYYNTKQKRLMNININQFSIIEIVPIKQYEQIKWKLLKDI